jgi:Flp pilus assembly protein TadG
MACVEALDGVRQLVGRQRGQALVEFALSVIVLSLILAGTIEFGFIFGHKVEINNAARAAARWGADHSVTDANNAWSSAATPPANSIEGQAINAGGTTAIPNNDSHIFIRYYDGGTQCGHVSAGSFVADGSYSKATCVVRGSLVSVTITNSYPLFTGLFPVAPSLDATAAFEVMN